MGVPVVASPAAASGVDAVPGEHLLVADGADEMCNAILQLTGSSGLRARLAHAARERVLAHHGWSSALTRLDAIVQRSMGQGGAPRALMQAS